MFLSATGLGSPAVDGFYIGASAYALLLLLLLLQLLLLLLLLLLLCCYAATC